MSTVPTISVRQLDANHDPMYGNGQQNFLVDIYAVAQLIDTSLLLFQGEWWNQLSAGFPLFQQVLGQSGVGNNPQIVALLIQQTILSVPYVQSIANVAYKYTQVDRSFSYTCTVITPFGNLDTTLIPGMSASLPIGG